MDHPLVRAGRGWVLDLSRGRFDALLGRGLMVLLALLTAAFYLHFVGQLFAQPDKFLWDLPTYYHAAQAQAQGLDPYDVNVLSRLKGAKHIFNFVYPPLTLYLFRPLVWFSYQGAYYLFLSLKLLALLGLFVIWRRFFLGRDMDLLFYPFAFLAFNSAVGMDLMAGNISLFEQFLLWAALAFFVRGRLGWFAGFVLASALFKVVTSVFLALLLLEGVRGRRILLASLAAGLGVVAANLAYSVDLTLGFMRNAVVLSEKGLLNPALLPFLKDLGELISGRDVEYGLVWPIYFVIAGLLVAVSAHGFGWLRTLDPEARRRLTVLFACLLYAVAMPRIKDYSYILLLAPTFHCLKNLGSLRGSLVVLAAAVLSGSVPRSHVPSEFFAFVWNYNPLLAAYLVWWLFLDRIRNLAQTQEKPGFYSIR